MQDPIGILGLGTFLPPEVRKNDWWPAAIVETWRSRMQANLVRAERDRLDPKTAAVTQTLKTMEDFRDDPFKGARERRVMPEGMLSSDMEVHAGEDALRTADVRPDQIDALFVYSQLPDYLTTANHALVHARLGLRPDCFTIAVDSACNSFLSQLELAEGLIRTGRVRRALLIQSSGILRACKAEDEHSAWFGDGATAQVVGTVSPGKGLLGRAHRTDGTFHSALVTGHPGKRWWDGIPFVYNPDRALARKMLVSISDLAKEVIGGALADAGLRAEDVDFYATHQSTHWFRKATQESVGLTRAKSVDTFAWTGSLATCNVPFVMALGEREGLLKDGDLVAMYSGGGGITYSGAILRWGR